jgi:hypothetical protein
MTSQQRADRAKAVFDARMKGFTWSSIAARHGISERQVQRLYNEFRQNRPGLGGIDPLRTVEELIDQYDAAIDELAALSSDTSHDGTKLGAIRARIDVANAKHRVLMATGVLPQDLGRLWVEVDYRQTVKLVFGVLERHGLPEQAYEELLDALGGPPQGFDMNGSSPCPT